MKRLIVPSAILAAGVAFLVGCGDENNTTEITQVVGMQVVEAGEALPKCTADNEGAMVYSVDSAEAFYCVSRKWTSMKGEKGEDGKKGADGKNGAAGADGKDGKDGKDGAAGANGKDGSSCTAKALKNGKGYKIVCGGDSVGVVLNGEKGDPGVKGDSGVAGTNCEIVNDQGNVVELKCGTQTTTLYKTTVCGKTPYDPKKKFCYGVDTYDYCDGKVYNPDKQFCAKFDDESEQVYKMTTIKGVNYTKTWMAENLNYETEAGSFCCKDSTKYCTKYGRLYTWATAVGKSEEECGWDKKCNLDTGYVRGVCPKGWHLPDTTEWNALFAAVGGEATAGTMLKSTEGWNDYEGTSGNGSDTYFFSALPAGYRNNNGSFFSYEGNSALFWSSTEFDSYGAYYMGLYYDFDIAYLSYYYKYYGYSVRCLRD